VSRGATSACGPKPVIRGELHELLHAKEADVHIVTRQGGGLSIDAHYGQGQWRQGGCCAGTWQKGNLVKYQCNWRRPSVRQQLAAQLSVFCRHDCVTGLKASEHITERTQAGFAAVSFVTFEPIPALEKTPECLSQWVNQTMAVIVFNPCASHWHLWQPVTARLECARRLLNAPLARIMHNETAP
jgi:hypothetical protein